MLVLWCLFTAWCLPPLSPRSRASCFTACLCLELVGETVYIWSAFHTVRTTATASMSGVRVVDPTCSLPANARCFCGGFRAPDIDPCVRSKVNVTSHTTCDVML